MLKARRWIPVGLMVLLAGCSFPVQETVYFSGYDHVVTVEGWRQQFGRLQLAPSEGQTTFRAVVLDIVVPTILAHPGKCLQFVMPDEEIVAGAFFAMSDLEAFCIGMDAYTQGAGFVQEGTITIESVEDNRVTLTLSSPQLDERFWGTHVFQRKNPSLAKGGPGILKGQIRNPTRPQPHASRDMRPTGRSR